MCADVLGLDLILVKSLFKNLKLVKLFNSSFDGLDKYVSEKASFDQYTICPSSLMAPKSLFIDALP